MAVKKRLADAALNAAKAAGASYADVRIGRYLNQGVFTREKQVQNIVSTESYGVGVRVIANGTWGFASTNTVTEAGIAKAAQLAVQIAKANCKVQKEQVQLAPQKGYGEVSWKAPIQQNAFEVPIKDKVDLLLAANAAALDNGRLVHQLGPVSGERAEVLCQHRRLLHRPGHSPHLPHLRRHGRRPRLGQVPLAPGPELAHGHGLRVPHAQGRRQGGRPRRAPT